MRKSQSSLSIQRVTSAKCEICQSPDINHYISYWDPNGADAWQDIGKHHVRRPQYAAHSCAAHVAESTAVVLQRAGVLEPPAPPRRTAAPAPDGSSSAPTEGPGV